MNNYPNISKTELDKIIIKTNSAKKSLMKYLIILISVSIAVFYEYLIWLNTNVISLGRFTFVSIAILFFLLGLLFLADKSSLPGGLFRVECAINNILHDDFSFSYSTFRGIHPLIIIHPAYKAIVGLYLFNYGRPQDGLFLINKAAKELPSINNAINNGIVVDKNKFKELNRVIQEDLYPDTFLKFLYTSSRGIVIVLTIYILVYFLWFCLNNTFIVSLHGILK